jgi:two-component system NtrC family response regulator
MGRILIVDDDVQVNRLIAQILEPLQHEIRHAYTLEAAREMAAEEAFDLVYLDLVLPDGNGLDELSRLMKGQDPPEIVIITGVRDRNGAKYALETGVFDYLQKPLDLNAVRLTCQRALEFKALRKKRQEVRLFKRESIVGKNPKLQQCLEETARAAAVESNVLIAGETGTGKELVARAVHENSPRRENNFIIVDCAALKDTLMESILFGHEKGAFTGADTRQDGRVVLAHGGTLFLDEIGELDMEAQKRFLRLLNNKSFYPLGAKTPVTSDFRLVSATNRDLEEEVARDRFRSDLYYRLCGQMIHLPPLRERKDDLRELVFYYVDLICRRMKIPSKKIYPEFLEALSRYDWPGNVRELINHLDAAISNFPDDPTLQPRHLPAPLRVAIANEAMQEGEQPPSWTALADQLAFRGSLPDWKALRRQVFDTLEKRYFQELISRTGGRAKDMAKLSGLTQARIYELFKKYNTSHSH